ncbi:761_t:CDS:2, partial [Scutellospora calospora]
EIKRIKHSKAIRTLVEQEAVKNYSPLVITVAIKEYATIKLGLGSTKETLELQDVDAHFFASIEDSNTVEAKDIKITFSSISAGEQECKIILCVVLVMRIWLAKIYKKEPQDIIIAAIHKRTRIGCEKLVQDAINSVGLVSTSTFSPASASYLYESAGILSQ